MLRRAGARTLGALFAIALARFAFTQDEPSLHVDVGLVNVAFSVRRLDGSFVQNVSKDDVEVFEGGVKQNVQFFGGRSDLPLTIGLVEDFSPSQDKFNRKHSIDTEAFLKQVIRPEDGAFLVCFGNHVRLVSDVTNSPVKIQTAMHEYDHHPGHFKELGPDEGRYGGTALFDAIFFSARERMRNLAGRKAMLVFSDGEDNSSERSLGTAIEAAEGADAIVYGIRYTEIRHHRLSKKNQEGIAAMARLSEETGGRAFDAGQMEMTEVFREIGEELRSLYELAYTSTDHNRDGKFRRIEIRAKNPEWKVRARLGYFEQ